MFIKDIYDKLSETEKPEVEKLLISKIFRSIIYSHIETLNIRLLAMDVTMPEAKMVREYILIRAQLDTWREANQFVDDLILKQAERQTGERK